MDAGTTTANDRRIVRWIFIACLVVRGLFLAVTSGLDLDLDRDNRRYEEQSESILHGNFDLETQFFITAPFYPFTQAFFKLVLGEWWKFGIGLVQLLLASWSGVVLYRLAGMLFDRRVALTAAAIHAVFPLTLLWVGTRAQDMPFQIALIFSLYALVTAARGDRPGRTALAALLFSVTFLTKSHILLFAPFIPLYYWLNMPAGPWRRVGHVALFTGICLAATLPFGLYNLRHHGLYVISSTGQGGHFLTGHNEDVYRFIVDPPPLGSAEHRRIFNMQYRAIDEIADSLAVLDHKGQQELYLAKGLEWCRENPGKLLELSAYDLYYFLLPGLNPHHYGRLTWLAMFVISLPLYAFAYAGLWMALRADLRKHGWMLGLVCAMVVFSVVFYVQNRFRTITLEPYYIIYGSFALLRFARRAGLARRFPVLAAPVEA